MRKLIFSVVMIMLANITFGGGILTNSNQSAQFIRMLSRNASLDIDAVYYNPAGLIKLEDGWHFGLYNQTIFQDKNVYCGYPLLNDPNYLGTVFVPVYPNVYAVYKKEKWAFSFGFGPNAGGGSAEFERGLPSFEIPISKVVPGLAGLSQINPALAVTGYDADLTFKGTSVFWGFQLGATYEINEMLSVYGGVRYMPSKNIYQGSIKNIQFNVNGVMVGAPEWLTQTSKQINDKSMEYAGLSVQAATASTLFGSAATQLQPIVDGGGGNYTLSQVQAAGYISVEDKAKLEGGLKLMGIPQSQIDVMPTSTIQVTYNNASTKMASDSETAKGASQLLGGVATELNANASQLQDKEVDTEQTGNGFTPILGLSFSPNEDWNIGIKYEHKTYLTLTNNTTVDDLGLFPDGDKSDSDLPGILGIGVGFKGLDWLEAQVSFTQYFSKRVYWGINVRDLSSWKDVDQTKIRQREVEKNDFELGLGLQFNVLDNFAVSIGGIYGAVKPTDSFQSDFSYVNPFYSIGGGVMWKISDKLNLDAGFSNVFYQDQTVTFADPVVPSYQDTYGKTAMTFAVGLSYSIF